MANARTNWAGNLATEASHASRLFAEGQRLARIYSTQGYATSLVQDDFEGTLADASPEDAKITIEALNRIDAVLDEASNTNSDRTLREGLFALAATHR